MSPFCNVNIFHVYLHPILIGGKSRALPFFHIKAFTQTHTHLIWLRCASRSFYHFISSTPSASFCFESSFFLPDSAAVWQQQSSCRFGCRWCSAASRLFNSRDRPAIHQPNGISPFCRVASRRARQNWNSEVHEWVYFDLKQFDILLIHFDSISVTRWCI